MKSMQVQLIVSEENTADPSLEFDFDMEEVARAVCETVLEQEACPVPAEVSLSYVGDEEIRSINYECRGLDQVTDVLSFPNFPFEGADGPGDWAILSDAEGSAMQADLMDPESGRLLLGDIVLNLNRTASQAEEFGHSRKREFAFLIAHSMLHLCGYDHMTPEDASVMFARQESVLSALQITREV